MPSTSMGNKIGTPMPWERSLAISKMGGLIEVEAMKAENANVKEQRCIEKENGDHDEVINTYGIPQSFD